MAAMMSWLGHYVEAFAPKSQQINNIHTRRPSDTARRVPTLSGINQ